MMGRSKPVMQATVLHGNSRHETHGDDDEEEEEEEEKEMNKRTCGASHSAPLRQPS